MVKALFAKLKWQLILILARRLPDCKTITPTLSESIDRNLTFKERIVTRLHLFTCEACARYLEQIGVFHDLIHKCQAEFEQTTSPLTDAAKERLKAALASTK